MAAFTQDQLTFLRRALEMRRGLMLAEVTSELGTDAPEQLPALASEPMDAGDRLVFDLLGKVETQRIGQQLGTLRDVSAARQRLRDGTYGVCSDCGADIGYQRLHQYPTAQRCTACQNPGSTKASAAASR